MTIEELKDLIDNTINENGAKAITGQALNLALNELVNAVAEAATTGGSGVKRLYVDVSGDTLTAPEQLASNAALYTEIVTALTNDEFPPQVGALIATEGIHEYLPAVEIIHQNSMLVLKIGTANIILTSDGNTQLAG